jgi:hypothetical protein
MSLRLGKSFDRNYNFRLPFNRGYYDIGIFFNKKSTFLLFSVDAASNTNDGHGVKINMFKNLESSKFCETFIELHNYKKSTLDILNQFKEIKSHYYHEVSFIMNETINLGKVEVSEDRVLFDCLNIYGFTLNSYLNEFIFVITERQNIVKSLGRKIVRTSGIQIATSSALQLLNDYHQDAIQHKEVAGIDSPFQSLSDEVIKL